MKRQDRSQWSARLRNNMSYLASNRASNKRVLGVEHSPKDAPAPEPPKAWRASTLRAIAYQIERTMDYEGDLPADAEFLRAEADRLEATDGTP